MATATAPAPVKPAVKAPVKGKGAVKPSGDELAKLTAALRDRWNVADKGETDARKLFEAADIAWQNARVIKVRVAYAAAMVTPFEGGTNLLNAARILLTDEDATPAKRTSQAKSRKNTLRNYVDAGAALQEKGLANRITEPDEEERKIVAAVFREGNKRDRAEAKGDAGDDTLDGGNTPLDAPDEDEAVTYAHLVAHVAQMNKVLDMITAGGVVISEREAGNMADMLNSFQMKLSAYADGK